MVMDRYLSPNKADLPGQAHWPEDPSNECNTQIPKVTKFNTPVLSSESLPTENKSDLSRETMPEKIKTVAKRKHAYILGNSLITVSPPTNFPAVERRVMNAEGRLIRIWEYVVAALLTYTATVFPYFICFYELRVTSPLEASRPVYEEMAAFNFFVDVMFFADLVANFILPYVDANGDIVTRPEDIWIRYLTGWFWLDLFACIPPQLFGGNDANKSVRLLRLGRISRLLKVSRLQRVGRQCHYICVVYPTTIGSRRLLSVLNSLFGFLVLLHILGCGWYLVAYLNDDPDDTWLAKRIGMDLLSHDIAPYDQWLASLYFVLTVFTSVGFGDIYATTRLEISYVMMLQIIGAVGQSMIVSEMIKVLTRVDENQAQVLNRKNTVAAFAEQSGLSKRQMRHLHSALEQYIVDEASGRANFDRHHMQDLLLRCLPPLLQNELVDWVHDGKLRSNIFFRISSMAKSDPRLFLCTCVHMAQRNFVRNEVVYHFGAHPMFLFLILEGVFSYVAMPSTSRGGLEILGAGFDFCAEGNTVPSKAATESLMPYSLRCTGSYFGEWEIVVPAPRSSTVRAETTAQAVLLPRQAFLRLVLEFPQFVNGLKLRASRRRNRLQMRMKQCTKMTTYLNLAASDIQLAFRCKKVRNNVMQRALATVRSAMMFGVMKLSGESVDDRAFGSILGSSQPSSRRVSTNDTQTTRILRDLQEDNHKLRQDQMRVIRKMDSMWKDQREMTRMLHEMHFSLMSDKR